VEEEAIMRECENSREKNDDDQAAKEMTTCRMNGTEKKKEAEVAKRVKVGR
jgi:hypothetical protein